MLMRSKILADSEGLCKDCRDLRSKLVGVLIRLC